MNLGATARTAEPPASVPAAPSASASSTQPIDVVNHDDFVFRDPFGEAARPARAPLRLSTSSSSSAACRSGWCSGAPSSTRATSAPPSSIATTRRRAAASSAACGGRSAWASTCVDTPEVGTVSFTAGGGALRDARRRVAAGAPARSRRRARSRSTRRFSEETPPMEPMRLCTRAGATGWVYARKTAGLGMRGTLRWDDTTYDLGAIDIYGHHDWSAGFMRRETFWNWGCLAGRTSRRPASPACNVSCGRQRDRASPRTASGSTAGSTRSTRSPSTTTSAT